MPAPGYMQPQKKEPRYYTRPTERVTTAQAQMFAELYGLPTDTVTKYSREDDRFLLPVESPGFRLRGYVARSMSGAEPKTLTYNHRPDEPFIHYAMSAVGDYKASAAVIVEDWFSAEKVALTNVAVGVSIQGTRLAPEMVTEIAALGLPTYIALDLDAFGKSLSFAATYRERFPKGLKVWRLKQDLKYEPVERIEAALRGEFYDFGEATSRGTTQGEGSV